MTAHTRLNTPSPDHQRTNRNSRLVDTCKWVETQLAATPDSRVNTWVFDQQRLFLDKERPRFRRTWDDVGSVYSIGDDVRWIKTEGFEEVRRRVDSRIRQRIESESVAARKEKAMKQRWIQYDLGCKRADEAEPGSLSFNEVPWPVLRPPTLKKTDILEGDVEAFLLSPLHSVGLGSKERLKAALLRWHPDRCRVGLLTKVKESERAQVEAVAQMVARELTSIRGKL
uniref:J domain-containing protein n=1 Tax=Mycena chlorophos TaxID=658473 RepID=A0ABQ0LZ11_MYCCL|nr:predicted protein [Mycena chlorophos]